MTSGRLRVVLAVGMLAAGARPAAAQFIPERPSTINAEGASAAYLALTLAPVGGLAPSAGYVLRRPGGPRPPVRLHARYGTMERDPGVTQRLVAATLDVPVEMGVVSFTAGRVDFDCADARDGDFVVSCAGGMTYGAQLGTTLAQRVLDSAGGSAVVLGFEGTVSYADVTLLEARAGPFAVDVDAATISTTFALPVALVVRAGGLTVAPVLVPRLGYGHARAEFNGDGDTRAAARFLLGAGVALRVAERFGLEVGAQKVFIRDGEIAVGAGLSAGF